MVPAVDETQSLLHTFPPLEETYEPTDWRTWWDEFRALASYALPILGYVLSIWFQLYETR